MNGGIKAAEVDAALAKLLEDTFNIIGPGRFGIFLEIVHPEEFGFGKGGGRELDFAVGPGSGGDMDVAIDGEGHHQPFVVIGVIAEQFEPTRGAHDVDGSIAEVSLEYGLNVRHA